jgi:hypothetical protein
MSNENAAKLIGADHVLTEPEMQQLLDEVRTAERRAVVERIRQAVVAYDRDETTLMAVYEALDEEVAR